MLHSYSGDSVSISRPEEGHCLFRVLDLEGGQCGTIKETLPSATFQIPYLSKVYCFWSSLKTEHIEFKKMRRKSNYTGLGINGYL